VGPVPGRNAGSITVAPGRPGTVVVADTSGLVGTFDGGRTWTTQYADYQFSFVGFTTATQGVAVAWKPFEELLMTRDGGHTWAPVGF
jgi:photosystem II stability/assembly factor-like uncharacterized protein